MNTPVSFELAKLLKEKRFDRECNSLLIYEIRNGDTEWKLIELFERNNKDTYDFLISCDTNWQKHYLRPTIAEVVMWLYEKHGIWLVSSYELNIKTHKREWFWIAIKKGEEIAYQYKDFNSSKEAYEAAIKHTLNNLI